MTGPSLARHLAAVSEGNLGRLWRLWIVLLVIGAVGNFGTAVLRVPEILPTPRPLDLASYYAGAWAMRDGASPYYWPQGLVESLSRSHGLSVVPSPSASPPPWIWMSQVLTPLSFPTAAWLWLLLSLALLAWSTRLLAQIGGYAGWRAALALVPVTLTFGSVFLNLTLGQNCLFVLVAALVAGRYLAGYGSLPGAAGFWVVAVAAKIYPVLWVLAWPFLRRWRLMASALVLLGALFAAVAWLEPQANRDYWMHYLSGRGQESGAYVSADDQSLEARILLFGRTNRLWFGGLDAGVGAERVWHSPWQISLGAARLAAWLVFMGLAVGMVLAWRRAVVLRNGEAIVGEGLFYALVLASLLPVPHTERYNHVLLLPAMAWLWARGTTYRSLVVIAYCLVGLSRLNHLWARLLDWPLGPIATGGCTYAVLVLGFGIAHCAVTRKVSISRPTG